MWVVLMVRNWPDVPKTMLVGKRTFRNVWHVLGGEFVRPERMQSLLGESGDLNIGTLTSGRGKVRVWLLCARDQV